MRSQALPMRTIAFILIGIVALAIVAVFFFSSFNYGKNGTSILTNTSSSQINSARCNSAVMGSCPTGQYCDPTSGSCVYHCPPNYYACDDSMTCVQDCDSDCGGKSASGGECQ